MNKDDLNQKKMDCLIRHIQEKARGGHRWRMLIKFATADNRIMQMLIKAISNLQPSQRETVYKEAKHIPILKQMLSEYLSRGLFPNGR